LRTGFAVGYSEAMTERFTIVRLGHRGDGIAEGRDGPIYVPFALPGETITAEAVTGHPDRRHLLTVEAASPERAEPVCPHFGVCGGCALQHWQLPPQHDWKRGLVIEALRRHGLDPEVRPTIDAHGAGRRRATFHARRGTHDVVEVGFAAPRAHHIVAIDRCPILVPSMADAIDVAWGISGVLEPGRKPLDIQVTASETGLDIDVRGSGPLPADRAAALAKVAETHRLARLTRHGEMIVQRAQPVLTMGRAQVPLPPGAFLQATAAGEEMLARLVREAAGKAKTVSDLFCGVGPFALRLAETARVTAIDSDAGAIAALTQAAKATQGLKPVEAQTRDLFRRPLVAQELKRFDAVVFDPPRQGAETQARELGRSAVPRVIAVSCDAMTFARDAEILIKGGYTIDHVTPVDQFRYSPHVEIVASFTR
jgi:23S rRNA (uracil1939-C5)-methyltransferase